MSAEQPEEDDITWGSDELPIENINSMFTGGEPCSTHAMAAPLERMPSSKGKPNGPFLGRRKTKGVMCFVVCCFHSSNGMLCLKRLPHCHTQMDQSLLRMS